MRHYFISPFPIVLDIPHSSPRSLFLHNQYFYPLYRKDLSEPSDNRGGRFKEIQRAS